MILECYLHCFFSPGRVYLLRSQFIGEQHLLRCFMVTGDVVTFIDFINNVFWFSQDLDIDPKDANKGTPEETGSYLVSKELPKHCLYTRLSSLQKLKVTTFPVYNWAALVAQTIKNPPAMQKTQVQSLSGEDALEEGMAIRSSVLAWRIPWTEESGGLQSRGPQRATEQKADFLKVTGVCACEPCVGPEMCCFIAH